MHHGIYVAMPETVQSCFIVMPYGKTTHGTDIYKEAMDRTYNAILEGVVNAGLLGERGDKFSGDRNFVEEIFHRTRSAKMILVDCSPDPETGKPSPNVMYELGLAHALGRPTIIISSDVDALPIDIKNMVALPYDQHALPELSTNLRVAIHQLLERVKKGAG